MNLLQFEIPLGEQLEAVRMSAEEAEKERSSMTGEREREREGEREREREGVPGMNRITKHAVAVDAHAVLCAAAVYESGNNVFTAQTRSAKELVIVSVKEEELEVGVVSLSFTLSPVEESICHRCAVATRCSPRVSPLLYRLLSRNRATVAD